MKYATSTDQRSLRLAKKTCCVPPQCNPSIHSKSLLADERHTQNKSMESPASSWLYSYYVPVQKCGFRLWCIPLSQSAHTGRHPPNKHHSKKMLGGSC